MTLCPTCGGAIAHDKFAVDLNTDEVIFREHRIACYPPIVAALLFSIARRWPEPVMFDRLFVDLWGARPPENPAICLRVYASLARRVVRPTGVTIESVFGRGYRLVIPARKVAAHD